MMRKRAEDPQERQDICRAEFLMALEQGLTRDESAEALRRRAAVEGLSVHAVALAVLSNEPTDELSIDRSSSRARQPARRHLYALGSRDADRAPATSGPAAFTLQRGRHHRR